MCIYIYKLYKWCTEHPVNLDQFCLAVSVSIVHHIAIKVIPMMGFMVIIMIVAWTLPSNWARMILCLFYLFIFFTVHLYLQPTIKLRIKHLSHINSRPGKSFWTNVLNWPVHTYSQCQRTVRAQYVHTCIREGNNPSGWRKVQATTPQG